MEPFEIDVVITRKQVLQLYTNTSFKSSSYRFLFGCIIISILCITYLIMLAKSSNRTIDKGVWIGLLAIIALVITTVVDIRQKANRVHLEPIKYRFTDDAIFINAKDSEEKIGWSRIIKTVKRSGLLLLYINKTFCYLLPLNKLNFEQIAAIERHVMEEIS